MYLNFLKAVQQVDNKAPVIEAQIKVEGSMYSESSLFRMVKALDQLISLSSTEGSAAFEVIQQFSNPDNLRHIIELSVEASTQNQILI